MKRKTVLRWRRDALELKHDMPDSPLAKKLLGRLIALCDAVLHTSPSICEEDD